MADIDMICNNPKCRKRLTATTWITSCSHAFCEEDAYDFFLNNATNNIVCPACKTSLYETHDVVKVDLNPSEKYKSMILAGLRPEIIVDIASRALTFWQYQIFQELEYHKSLAKQYNHKVTEVEDKFETQITKLKADLQKERRNKEVLEQDVKNQAAKITELQDRIVEKNYQVQNLMNVNTKLRCNTAKPQPGINDCSAPSHQRKKYSIGPQGLPDVRLQSCEAHRNAHTQEFEFNPVTPPPEGGNIFH